MTCAIAMIVTTSVSLSSSVPPASEPRALPPSVLGNGGTRVRYFAFGSNLLLSKMAGRGETEVLHREPGVVRDHRLAFNMRMFPPLEPSMASIEPSAGATCEGALYTLSRAGYEALWRSEGGSMARPGYEEVVVSVACGEQVVQAMTLRAAPWMRMSRDAPPSSRYKKLIVDGAQELGLSTEYVASLSRMPSASPGRALTAIARAHGVVAVLLFRLKLRQLLMPLRAACYALLRTSSPDEALARRLLSAASEIATCALLLPTAAVGALIRLVLRLVGRERWVTFGPPPQKEPKEDKDKQESAA